MTPLIQGRQPVTPFDGAGCGLASSASSAGSREAAGHRPPQLRGAAPGRAGRGADERRRKLPGSGGPKGLRPSPEARSRGPKSRGEAPKGAPARVMGRRSLRGTGPTARRATRCGVPHRRLSALHPLGLFERVRNDGGRAPTTPRQPSAKKL
jgi:hypothetical protein